MIHSTSKGAKRKNKKKKKSSREQHAVRSSGDSDGGGVEDVDSHDPASALGAANHLAEVAEAAAGLGGEVWFR